MPRFQFRQISVPPFIFELAGANGRIEKLEEGYKRRGEKVLKQKGLIDAKEKEKETFRKKAERKEAEIVAAKEETKKVNSELEEIKKASKERMAKSDKTVRTELEKAKLQNETDKAQITANEREIKTLKTKLKMQTQAVKKRRRRTPGRRPPSERWR